MAHVATLAIAALVWVLLSAAQTTTVNCTGEPWALNAEGDSPCIVWAKLSVLCRPGGFDVPPLRGAGTAYLPPKDSLDINACQCNVAAYNLMSACSLCQPGITTQSLFNESTWRTNCTVYNSTGVTIAHPLVDIPAWALQSDQGRTFEPTQASLFAVSASTTASESSITSTSTAGSAVITSNSGAPTDQAAAKHSDTPAIVGGVVGGLAGIALLGLLGFFIFRHRSNLRSRPALTPAREIKPSNTIFGLPPEVQVQHFVPVVSSNNSFDNLPHAALHPYAANYAVARNMAETRPESPPDVTPPASFSYPIAPVRGYSTTGNVGPQYPTFYPKAVEAHLPPSPAANSPPSQIFGAHPYANPVADSQYSPVRRPPSPPWNQPPTLRSILPPLRAPRPVRHPSNGTDFSPDSLSSSSYASTSPLAANKKRQPVSSSPKAPDDWLIE